MRFFSFFILAVFNLLSNPASAQKNTEQKVISGTILLADKMMPDSKTLLSNLKNTWKLRADSVNVADKTVIFSTSSGATVMIAFLDYPAAPDVVGASARLSWLWKTAQEECSKHQAQAVISVIGPASKTLELYKIFTQTAAGLLETAQAPGIIMDSQYLLLSRGYYLAAARNMVQNQSIPLYCWVYFGRPGGGNGFTFGLTEFGLQEMEIVNAEQSEAAVHSTLYDAAMLVVKNGAHFSEGQVLTTDEGSKLKVQQKKGTYLEDLKVLSLSF